MTDYGASDTSTTSLGANQFPISDVYVPNDALRALEGGPVSTDSGGKKSSPASMYVKDGNDLAQGATTDAAVTGDVTGSLSAKLRGLSKIFASVWDSVNAVLNVRLWVTGAPSFIFKPVKNIAITAGSPVSIWTPASGKKFRLMGFMLYTTGIQTFGILLEDATGAGNEFLRIPRVNSTNTAPVPISLAPYGYLSSATNNQLFVDMTGSGNVEGYVYGTEE